ncbi:MAG: 2-octaprenylphenol hydroxylase [Arenicella sp.]|jgi:2-octaprenylphenol hydroxylase
MSASDSTFDVIVVGAGLVGSAFALLLSRVFCEHHGLKIAVVEHAAMLTKADQQNQRVVALGDAATDVLKQVGVFESLATSACYAYDKMFVWDENTDGEITFAAQDYNKTSLGYLIDSQEATRLLQSQLAADPNILTFYEYSAVSLRFACADRPSVLAPGTGDGFSAELRSNSAVLRAPLVVAADGNLSWVRQQAKIISSQHDYQQRGIVAKIHTELSHDNTAWQRFLETGPVAALPLADNQSSIVWSANLTLAEELMAMSDEDFEIALASALEGRLGKIQLLSKRLSFPLKSQRAERYFKKGVVLIGDAAHSIHPLAGQGANLGFKDAASLARVLKGALENNSSSRANSSSKTDTSHLGSLAILERYQRARKLDNQQTDMMMSALHLAYQNNAPWWLGARSVGMNWIGSSNSIKRLLARQAMGI